jgi:hypothetical protein
MRKVRRIRGTTFQHVHSLTVRAGIPAATVLPPAQHRGEAIRGLRSRIALQGDVPELCTSSYAVLIR